MEEYSVICGNKCLEEGLSKEQIEGNYYNRDSVNNMLDDKSNLSHIHDDRYVKIMDTVILTGTLKMTNGTANIEQQLPSGFTKNNCFVEGFMLGDMENTRFGYGMYQSSYGYVGGALGHCIIIYDNFVKIQIHNPTPDPNGGGWVASGTNSYQYKLILRKFQLG